VISRASFDTTLTPPRYAERYKTQESSKERVGVEALAVSSRWRRMDAEKSDVCGEQTITTGQEDFLPAPLPVAIRRCESP